jgi:transposase
MTLGVQERIETVLCGHDGWSHKNVADKFNRLHPERDAVPHSAVVKLFNKFKETGSVASKPRSGRPSPSELVPEAVMAVCWS